MGEEGSNVNNSTESQPQPQSVDSVPEDHNLQQKESEKPNPPNTVSHVPNEPPLVQKVADHADKKDTEDSVDRDAGLARVVAEKRLALIKAWEESEKTKAENRQEAI
ncbi:Remorin, N-terminal [Sesbania bispinosa]|nr:Remorin, N-terminal [Sesbania bispinosa]